MDRIKKVFEYADKDDMKGLTKHQYKLAMTALFGYCPDEYEAEQALEPFPDKRIPFERFISWAWKKLSLKSNMVDLKSLYAYLDRDAKGYLAMTDLLKACKYVDLRVPEAIQKRAFKEMDWCQKGYVNFAEFLIFMVN